MSAKTKTKKVRMTSFMSGAGYAHAPGDIAELEADEADRVIAVGGGVEFVENDKQPEQQPSE